MASNRLSAHMASAPVRVFDTVHTFRVWRKSCLQHGQSVGFVPTMGALHEGHLQLVDASLRENDYTVVSIFVNPAQFAPPEDLASYPRTLPADLTLLGERQERARLADRLVVLVPQVLDMYPNGITQSVDAQVGAFVEVKGLSHQMEGGTRPTFFRGVATIVTKLFNVVLVRASTYPSRIAHTLDRKTSSKLSSCAASSTTSSSRTHMAQSMSVYCQRRATRPTSWR